MYSLPDFPVTDFLKLFFIKYYFMSLQRGAQTSCLDLHQFCLFNKTVSKLGIAE
jgi:hypothetical protein